jgi:hypothetical protein
MQSCFMAEVDPVERLCVAAVAADDVLSDAVPLKSSGVLERARQQLDCTDV